MRAGAGILPPLDNTIIMRVNGAENPVPPAEIICVIVDELRMMLVVIGRADPREWFARCGSCEILIS